MYSQNFVIHAFEKTHDLIQMQRNKRLRAIQKLDYNLKRMLNAVPEKLKKMSVQQFLTQYSGNMDIAFQKLCLPEQREIQIQQSYQSPPKNKPKKKYRKKS